MSPTSPPIRAHDPVGNDRPDWPRLCESLPRLGTVLCLYAEERGAACARAPRSAAPVSWQRELAGLLRAERVQASVIVDNEGPRESLWFLDGDDRPGFGLCLLPESDFLAWDQLLAQVPQADAPAPSRLRRLRATVTHWWYGAPPWCAGLRRFRFGAGAGLPMLALEPVTDISPTTADVARALIRRCQARFDPHADACCRECGRLGPLH